MRLVRRIALLALIPCLSILPACSSEQSDQHFHVVEIEQPDGSTRTVVLEIDSWLFKLRPMDPSLTYQIGPCIPYAGAKDTCISVHSVPPPDVEVETIEKFDNAIANLVTQGPFSICVDEDVPNQILTDASFIAEAMGAPGFWILPFPCIS